MSYNSMVWFSSASVVPSGIQTNISLSKRFEEIKQVSLISDPEKRLVELNQQYKMLDMVPEKDTKLYALLMYIDWLRGEKRAKDVISSIDKRHLIGRQVFREIESHMGGRRTRKIRTTRKYRIRYRK